MPTIRAHRAIASLALMMFCGLAGCTLGPDYARPAIATPETYRDASMSSDAAASLADRPWWEVFGDPGLVALVDEALAGNRDLRIAVSRIEQARSIRIQTRSPLYPQVGYGGGIERGRNSANSTPVFNGGETRDGAVLSLDAVWELDVWGRIRRADEAALARILASEEDRRAVMLTLISDVAQTYFQLLGLDAQRRIAERNRDSFGATLDIFRQRAAGGMESELPVLRARASQSSAAAAIPQIERDIALTENALCVLVGRAPKTLARSASQDDLLPTPEVPSGMPSQLLERRPDLRALEASMMAANAEIGAAIAEQFPRIGLSAFLGRVSNDLSTFTDGAAGAWGVAANLSGPLFEGGRLKAQVAQAQAYWDETVARYEQSVLVALREVADALISRTKLQEVEAEQLIAVSSLVEAVRLSTDRFAAGRASYYEIINAQQDLFPAEQALADTRTRQLLAYVQLYKALGGGWNLPDDDWRSGQETAGEEDAQDSGS